MFPTFYRKIIYITGREGRKKIDGKFGATLTTEICQRLDYMFKKKFTT